MSSPLESRVEEILSGATVVPQSRVEVLLENLVQQVNELSSATRWIGVTTTEIYDGSTTRSIVVDGKTKSAKSGDICSYNNIEFIWSGSAWQEFGGNSGIVADLMTLVVPANNGKVISIEQGALAAENVTSLIPNGDEVSY